MQINPKEADSGLRKVGSDLPFKHVKIDGSLMDFEDVYDADSTLAKHTYNWVAGKVGD